MTRVLQPIKIKEKRERKNQSNTNLVVQFHRARVHRHSQVMALLHNRLAILLLLLLLFLLSTVGRADADNAQTEQAHQEHSQQPQQTQQRRPPVRVAVVGAGIGGAAVAHFLHQHYSSVRNAADTGKGTGEGAGDGADANINNGDNTNNAYNNLELHVYEAADGAGGRCHTVEHRGLRLDDRMNC